MRARLLLTTLLVLGVPAAGGCSSGSGSADPPTAPANVSGSGEKSGGGQEPGGNGQEPAGGGEEPGGGQEPSGPGTDPPNGGSSSGGGSSGGSGSSSGSSSGASGSSCLTCGSYTCKYEVAGVTQSVSVVLVPTQVGCAAGTAVYVCGGTIATSDDGGFTEGSWTLAGAGFTATIGATTFTCVGN